MITRKLMQELRPEMDEALKPIAEKYGITIQVGRGMYGDLTGSFKVNLSATNDNGEDQRVVDFNRYADMFGLKKEWLGMQIQSGIGREVLTIIGLDPNKRKNMLVLRRESDGKIFIGPLSMAIRFLS